MKIEKRAPNVIMFTHQELTRILLKQADIHEGSWMIALKLDPVVGLNVNVGTRTLPGGIVLVESIGIQKCEPTHSLAVNADEVNPLKRIIQPVGIH